MFIEFTFILILSMALEILFQSKWIEKMHSLKIEQVTKLYGPHWHERTKTGTPTMGGVVFVPVFLVAMAASVSVNRAVNWHSFFSISSYPVMASLVGFADDWIKHRKNSSDGMTSLQKLTLQILITLPWAVWVAPELLEIIPGFIVSRYTAIALIAFAGVGLQNAVNVTDGLDGLAAGTALISFFACSVLLESSTAIFLATASACGICMGFLWHNSHPASVFMGDVGAHFISGLLLSVCVMSNAFILIIPFCFLYGMEIISVAIQIFSIRVFNKRVFLMSPIHHHFEMLGWSENKIVARFWLVHVVGMFVVLTLLFWIANIF